MRPITPPVTLAGALLLWPGLAGSALAQQGRGFEAGVQALLLTQAPVWAGGAVAAAWRPGGGARFSLSLGLGSAHDEVSGRGEALAHFLLSPRRRSGLGPYGFAGVAGVTGSRSEGYLVLGLGVERAPGGGSGWFLEGGVGGGGRIAVGWRWRRLGRGGLGG